MLYNHIPNHLNMIIKVQAHGSMMQLPLSKEYSDDLSYLAFNDIVTGQQIFSNYGDKW
jgi:hypothetical protein